MIRSVTTKMFHIFLFFFSKWTIPSDAYWLWWQSLYFFENDFKIWLYCVQWTLKRQMKHALKSDSKEPTWKGKWNNIRMVNSHQRRARTNKESGKKIVKWITDLLQSYSSRNHIVTISNKTKETWKILQILCTILS